MKFWKWFSFRDESTSETRIAEEYRRMPDGQLSQIDPSTLTPLSLRIYREEIARRNQGKKSK
ncbi:MAG TPA: hypothetical protein VK041_05885 [Opitutales bacterium]|nr:hypothetical protein [Opitutales bacterium]